MVAVLIIALAIAIFSYSILITSLDSMERSDVQDYRVKADALAEGAVEEAAYALKENPDYFDLPENQGILPERAGGYPDAEIKKELISNDGTFVDLWDDLPEQTIRAAKAEYELTAFEYPDLYFIWGDTDEATLQFVDEFEYRRHFYDYHYNPFGQSTDIFISAGSEVNDGLNDRVFSFGGKRYPADITRFQSRTNDAWEPNENDVLPAYFESEHDTYNLDTERIWAFTYDHDPAHPGRDINRIDLIADPGEFGLGSIGDTITVAGWNGVSFDPFIPIPPNYWDGPENSVIYISDGIPSTTLRVKLETDSIIDLIPGWNYGFKVGGVRYFFDSERYTVYYETPHPYDHLVANVPGSPRVQVIYSPHQYDSTDPLAANQMMRISLDWEFFLENGDSLTVVNLAAPTLAAGVLGTYTLIDGAGVTLQAQRQNTDVPLAIALLFDNDGDNLSSTKNYGYKISVLEYTDESQNWITDNNPVIQTPHLGNLGSFIDPFDPDEFMMYNTIYQPHVPGGGTLDGWWVHFDEGCDLFALNNVDDDYIRIVTPGYDPFTGAIAPDTHYFVNSEGPDGWRIGLPAWPNYHNVTILGELDYYRCGYAPFLEIYSYINDIGSYANVAQNWGLRATHLWFSATDANEIVDFDPHIASAVTLVPGEGYTNFGSAKDDRGEWWITEKDAEAIGVHINLETFDLDEGDYLVFYDADGNEVGKVTSRSYDSEYPGGSGPWDPTEPDASGPDPGDPHVTPPYDLPEFEDGSINLNETKGWVIIPGESAHIVLLGDGDDNEGKFGFEVDRSAWWSGLVNYDTTGPFERVDVSEKDYSDYMISPPEEYIDIR